MNYKPCHLSVMNYLFQNTGVSHNGTRLFTYQNVPLPGLNEADLIEADGLGSNSVWPATKPSTSRPAGR